MRALTSLERAEAIAHSILEGEDEDELREACLGSLWFLLVYGCSRVDLKRQFFLDRCNEVQESPDGYIDLWAREHGKSSIITFGMTLLDILHDPEITVGFFSHTAAAAKKFVSQLKQELEGNGLLKRLFPDVLYEDPRKDSPSWSLDGGITVKRQGNPKEATLEAAGVVEGQPTGRHYRLMVYDDVVVPESVGTPEMRQKTLSMLELSYNLGTRGGRRRFIGTRYHYQDAYKEIMGRGTVKPRIYPIEVDGVPLLLTPREVAEKRRDYGPFTFASQMMLDPKSDDSVGFKRGWLQYWSGRVEEGNRYILVDPANSKKKGSDYTAMWVVSLASDENWYVVDIVRDRLSLTERIATVMDLHRKWRPRVVAYEQYGLQADIEAIKAEQERVGYRFNIQEVGGAVAKFDRIQRLVPLFEGLRIYLPEVLWVRQRASGQTVDLVKQFEDDEYLAWPYAGHDDMLDALSRLLDVRASVPDSTPAGMPRVPVEIRDYDETRWNGGG